MNGDNLDYFFKISSFLYSPCWYYPLLMKKYLSNYFAVTIRLNQVDPQNQSENRSLGCS